MGNFSTLHNPYRTATKQVQQFRNDPQSLPVSLSLVVLLAAFAANAQNTKRNLIQGNIDEQSGLTIAGNIRPEVSATNDRGARDSAAALQGLQLVLHRSDEDHAAFTTYLDQLTDPASPDYHKWLTNEQIGTTYGPSTSDIARITDWLTAKGMTVKSVSPDRSVIEFDATVGLVRTAFHAAIHNLTVNGEAHFANVNNPEIPEALTTVVTGIASLHDFRPRATSHRVHPADRVGSTEGITTTGRNGLSGPCLCLGASSPSQTHQRSRRPHRRSHP